MVKYQSMNTNERGLHKMLDAMKSNVLEYQRYEDSKNTPQPKYYQWYLDIENIIDNYARDDCVLGKLLDKLSVHGKVKTTQTYLI